MRTCHSRAATAPAWDVRKRPSYICSSQRSSRWCSRELRNRLPISKTSLRKLKKHVQLKLVGEIDVGDAEEMEAVLKDDDDGDLTLAKIADRIEKTHEAEPIDREWLKHVTDLIAKLKDLKWRYQNGTTGKGRASMGMLNATGCTSVWGSTYPFNPYPFPWANHLFQDSVSMAMGVFEGHMAKMAEGFKTIRLAELALKDQYDPERHAEEYRYFDWQDFTDDEFHLCPPGRCRRWRRCNVRHRFSESVPRHDGGQTGQSARCRYPGLLEYRWPGMHFRIFRSDFGHGPVRQGDQGQGGSTQGDRSYRHGAPHDVLHAKHDGVFQSHDRGICSGIDVAATGAIQSVHILPAGTRHR